MLLKEAVQSLKTRVDAACGPINPWLKPFDHRMFCLMMCRSGLLGLVFVNVQVKFEPERPQCQAHVSLISLLKPLEASLVVATGAIIRREGCTRGVRFDSIPHYCNVSFVAVSPWHATLVH
jgi:hypothetical protein